MNLALTGRQIGRERSEKACMQCLFRLERMRHPGVAESRRSRLTELLNSSIPSPTGLFSPHVQPDFSRYLQQSIVAMQHESLTCSHSHLGTVNRAVSRNVPVWEPDTAPLAVCVREHAREVKPRRSVCCTESEELCFSSWLIAFRCDQDCSHPTCNQSFQEAFIVQLQRSQKVSLIRIAAVLVPTTGSSRWLSRMVGVGAEYG